MKTPVYTPEIQDWRENVSIRDHGKGATLEKFCLRRRKGKLGVWCLLVSCTVPSRGCIMGKVSFFYFFQMTSGPARGHSNLLSKMC